MRSLLKQERPAGNTFQGSMSICPAPKHQRTSPSNFQWNSLSKNKTQAWSVSQRQNRLKKASPTGRICTLYDWSWLVHLSAFSCKPSGPTDIQVGKGLLPMPMALKSGFRPAVADKHFAWWKKVSLFLYFWPVKKILGAFFLVFVKSSWSTGVSPSSSRLSLLRAKNLLQAKHPS